MLNRFLQESIFKNWMASLVEDIVGGASQMEWYENMVNVGIMLLHNGNQ